MERSVFRYIWRYSKREQIVIAFIVILSIPTYFLTLHIPKTIINGPISGVSHDYALGPARFLQIDIPAIPFFGIEEGVLFSGIPVEQTAHLAFLCMALFLLICINGGFKYFINTLKGQLGERMLRRLRFQLIHNTMQFPHSHIRRLKPIFAFAELCARIDCCRHRLVSSGDYPTPAPPPCEPREVAPDCGEAIRWPGR